MKFRIQCLVAAAALVFTAAALGFGDTYRCGVKRIAVGDSEQDMLDACGRPASRRASMQSVRDPSGRRRAAKIVNYVYEDRDRRTTVNIMVVDGEIIRIDSR